MFGLKKRTVKQEQKRETRAYTRFETENKGATWKQGVLQAQEHFNCDCRDGSIRPGVGVKLYYTFHGMPVWTYGVSGGVAGIFPVLINTGTNGYDQEGMFFLGKDGYIYAHDLQQNTSSKKVAVGEDARLYTMDTEQGRIYHMFVGKQGVYCTWDGGNSFTKIDSNPVNGASVCGGRFFYSVAPDVIRYSTKFRPFDFVVGLDEGGELYLPSVIGDVVGMEVLDRDLYVFGERGIIRYHITANAEKFECVETTYRGGRILRGSILRAGGEIIFLAEDGAYRLQGNKTERFCAALDLSIAKNGDVCKCGYFEDTVIMEYTMVAMNGEMKRNCAVLPLDDTDGFFTEIMVGLAGNAYVAVDGVVHQLSKDGNTDWLLQNAYFTTAMMDFGVMQRKTLTRITFFGKGQGKLIVRSALGVHEYPISIVNGRGVVKLLERGEAFDFVIEPYTGASFEGMRVHFHYAVA